MSSITLVTWLLKMDSIAYSSLGAEKLFEIYQRTGAPLHTSYAMPQLRAFYGNKDNEAIAKTIDKWATISSICLYRWSGRPQIQMPISYSEASWTGMLNFRTCSWDDQMVDLVETCDGVVQYTDIMLVDEEYTEGIDLLPPLADFDAALPFLREGIPRFNDDGSENIYWERWPELRAYPVNLFLGVGDGAAANIGSKCSGFSTSANQGSQRIAVTVGTSAAARVCLNLPLTLYPGIADRNITIPPGLFCYRVHRDRILVGGALTDGGSVIEWARSLLNLNSNESFDACMAQISKVYELERAVTESSLAMRGDITMIPFLGGERSTGFRGGAKGCISGLTRETTPNDVMYTCLESVVLRICCILELIREVCTPQCAEELSPNTCVIVASGKALERNTLWRSMLADCSSMDVVTDLDSSEGTSRGVAMLVAASLQQAEQCDYFATFNNVDEALHIAGIEKTNSAASVYWKRAKLSQESLIEVIAPTWEEK
jgi:gluconokinase